jgi:hypothetical protein
MYSFYRYLITILLAISTMGIANTALAFLSQGSPPVIPASKNIAASNSTSFTVTWRLVRTSGSGVTGTSVSSPNGEWRLGGIGGPEVTRYKVFRVLLQSKPVTPTTNFFFPESVIAPQGLVTEAMNRGFTTIAYVRRFSECITCGIVTISVTLNITSSATAGFSISRQSMRFGDNTIVKLLNKKEALKAKAVIDYLGSGQLEAEWEVADPSTAGGVPIFRRFRTVRKYLLFGDKATFVSPILPTTIAGAYMVRMRITSPAAGFNSPVIRYYVGSKGAQIAPPLPMRVGSPVDRVWFNENTRFRWEPVKGTTYYRLEIYNKPQETDIAGSLPNLGDSQTSKKPIRLQGGPVAGMMLPSNTWQTGLSASAQARLLGGHWYYWRIVAIGKDGKIVGLSPIREMRMP